MPGDGHTNRFYRAVHRAAGNAGATEAAAFRVELGDQSLTKLVHIRPDDADGTLRAKAITAFKELVAQCAQRDQDGVLAVTDDTRSRIAADGRIELSYHGPAQTPQFCLVCLLHDHERIEHAVALIARCTDVGEAKQRLDLAREALAAFDVR